MVSSLIIRRDLVEQLKGRTSGKRLLIPDSMLRTEERIFLDDATMGQVEGALGVPMTTLPVDSDFGLAGAILGLPVGASVCALPSEDDYYRYNL